MNFFKIKGLFKKLLFYQCALLCVIIAFLFLTISIFEKRFWSDYLVREASTSLKLFNPAIMRSFGRGMGKEDRRETIAEIKNALSGKEEILEASIIDAGGKVLFKTGEMELPPADLKQYKEKKDIFHRDLILKDNRKALDIVVPFQTMGRSNFLIRYIMYFPAIEEQIQNINQLIIVMGILAVVVAFALSYFYVKKITVPIDILKEKARFIRQGDIDQEIPVLEDEIGELAEALRAMIAELKKKQSELVLQNDRLQEAFDEVLFLQNQILNYEKYAALGKISAGISHEIDNPLGIIIGHAEYLKGELPTDSPIKEDIDTIYRESVRIKNILRGLLGFAKPRESTIKKIELGCFVKRVIDNFSFQKIFKKIEVRINAPEIFADADEDKLHQALVNIVLNAIQAMPSGGQIEVETGEEGNMAFVRITDSGAGIPEELKAKVFDIFFSTKKDGTGLGLAISKTYMEAMGGTINIHSTEGRGTTVKLLLPKAAKS